MIFGLAYCCLYLPCKRMPAHRLNLPARLATIAVPSIGRTLARCLPRPGHSQTLKTDGWFLGTYNVRLENDALLLIQKGDKHLYYNKETQAYTEWYRLRMPTTQYMPVSLTPEQFLQPWKVARRGSNENAAPGRCPVFLSRATLRRECRIRISPR